MKNRFFACAAATIALLIAGCETSGVSARIQEKSTVFNSLDAAQQRDIQNGVVGAGFTTDMVYMALGHPSKIVTSTDGTEIIWTYRNYYPPAAAYQSQLTPVNTGTPNTTPTMASSSELRSSKSLSDTRGGPQTSLSIPDLPADTLYLYFREGRVTLGQLESQRRK